jgi:hypothetical protein
MVGPQAASPYVTMFQSRRSYLVWKLYGRRLDGWTDDDFPSITKIGDLTSLRKGDAPIPKLDYNNENDLRDYLRDRAIDRDFAGSIMPPADAVKSGKVRPLSDEDRRTIVRWIDLGCPIDVDPRYVDSRNGGRDAAKSISHGWMGDDQRPTITLTYPAPGKNESLTRILLGMADAYSGLNLKSFSVTADCEIDGLAPRTNLAQRFQALEDGRWEMRLAQPLSDKNKAKLIVSVKDQQGNENRIERSFSVAP